MLPIQVSKSITDFLQKRTGKPVLLNSSISIGGGCINTAVKISTSAGVFFVKYNHAETYPEMFPKEAVGLHLLREANEIHIPEVIHYDSIDLYAYLLLEFISPGNRTINFWEKFGQELAALHRHSDSNFGLDHDNYIGSLTQSNRPHPGWTDFFIVERLEPMVKQARNKGEISSQLVSQFEKLYGMLLHLIPEEKPALLHGDLWSGNFMTDNSGNPCLIDPAVYYGHREIDLGMTMLFRGFSSQFYESYHRSFPLEKGWESRTDIFNLYPLLVHVNLFGGGYAGQVKNIVLRFV